MSLAFLSTLTFHMPSRNIDCVYAPTFASLRCDIRSGLRPEPSRRCGGDWIAVTLGPTGRGRALCATDSVIDPRSPVLAYGTTWRRGAIVCRSRRDGLRCTNRRGHGFFLSRQRYRVF